METFDDSVAQLVEHYTFNVGALGSNPSGITSKKVVFRQPFCIYTYGVIALLESPHS